MNWLVRRQWQICQLLHIDDIIAALQAVPQAGQLPEVKAAKVEKTVAELIREVMEASKAEAASEQYSMEPW